MFIRLDLSGDLASREPALTTLSQRKKVFERELTRFLQPEGDITSRRFGLEMQRLATQQKKCNSFLRC